MNISKVDKLKAVFDLRRKVCMSLKTKVIGIGAAGNKAAISVIENGVLNRDSVLLLNTTRKDIPIEYQNDNFIEFGSARGCGKDRDLAKQFMVEAISLDRDFQAVLNNFVEGDEKFITIVCSTEGGTGSGASVILGEYLQNMFTDEETGEITIPIHMVCLTGFEDDARGQKNTVDWFNDLNQNFIIQAISNKLALSDASVNGNRKKAEHYANKVFADRIAILSGKFIDPSEDNMDDMDLFKLNNMPGYMTVEKIELPKVTSSEQFNKEVKSMIDSSISWSTEPSAQRIGVIISASGKIQEVVDNSFSLIKESYGFPTELFTHSQDSKNGDDVLSIISSGMKIPIDGVKQVYNRLKKQVEKIDSANDSFFNGTNKFDTSFGAKKTFKSTGFAKDGVRQMKNNNMNSFFSKYGIKKQEPKVAKTQVKIGPAANDEL